MSMLFIEKPERFSSFISSNSDAEGMPKLMFLRVELQRVHPGMSDFVMRVSSPKYEGVKSGNVLSIRGTRAFTKFDTVKKLASIIGEEMAKREDATYDWASLDANHLANMLYNVTKFFAANVRLSQTQFTTEAL
jgi:hypothetical protein